VLPWDPDAPPFDPRDTSNREQLPVREVAERFIQLFYVEDNPRDAFMAWMHPDYIQHNPNAPTGRDATLAMMEASLARLPDLSHEVKRVVWGDADLVAIHFHFKYEPDTRGYSVVDILRIDGGYIREHWDVIQEVPDPATAKNSNGMF
jgi:predicted SnoaL-like aldol condensation-catalyzing enzyme